MERIRVLLIEDSAADARLIQDMLAEAKTTEFTVDWTQTLTGGLNSLGANEYDALLLDLGLPDSPQRSVTFTRTQTAAPALPIIILTGLDDETFAVTTVRRGAQDYLVKGKIDTDTLVRTIRYAIARKLGGERLFTAAELGRYDGKDGRPAHIAFKGRVYDATNSRLWKNGNHAGKHSAGADLSEAIANAPHTQEGDTAAAIIPDDRSHSPARDSRASVLYLRGGHSVYLCCLDRLPKRALRRNHPVPACAGTEHHDA